MRGSRGELLSPEILTRPLASMALAAMLAVLVATAPGVGAGEIEAPRRLAPEPSSPAAPPQSATSQGAPGAAAEQGIEATPLAPIDPAWTGTLGESDHPLPPSMWQGTPRPVVSALLPLLAATTSPTLEDLARRLLLSNATAPEGQDVSGQPSLAQLRIERLAALGQADAALTLLDTLPRLAPSDSLDRLRIELHFAVNDIPGACRQVQESAARNQGVWWDRAVIACQALTGDHAKAAFGLSLLHEQKAPPDDAFDALIDALAGRPAKLDKLPNATPMRMALLAAAKHPLPADALAAEPLALRAWADNAALPPEERLAAAERAVALGVWPPAALAELYAKVEFKPDELGSAIKLGKAPDGPRGRALLHAIARTDPTPEIRAAALRDLLQEARKRGEFIATARVIAPLLTELIPSKDLDAFALEAARALIAAGKAEAAQGWLALSQTAARAIYPSLHLAAHGAGIGEDAAGTHDWLAALDPHDAAMRDKATLALTLLTALGETVKPADWTPLISPSHRGPLPPAALWLDEEQAAGAKRLGETVLATLLLAAAGDHLSEEPIVLHRAITGLRAVGLEDDARALAVEAALAGGI